MNFIDRFLNKITMYKLVLYVLIALLIAAGILGGIGKIHYSPLAVAASALFLLAISLAANYIFAKIFEAPSNSESTYITALILALIVAPAANFSGFVFLFWAAVLAIASKYILAVGKKHLFNPAALAVAVTAFALNQSANWWIGTAWMLPFALVGGLLIVRKIRRGDLVFSFFAATALTTLAFSIFSHANITSIVKQAVLDSPIWFFAFIMLTEPLTTPPTKKLQVWYGALVGILFAPQMHLGAFYFTPEMALLTGNVFSYLVSPKRKLLLKFQDKIRLTPNTYDFIFQTIKPMDFEPGQYLEWTLAHRSPDNRGSRRYFTIASAPTEPELRLGIKFYNPTSSYKRSLYDMQPGDVIVASQLAGDFVLPKDPRQKLVFIAGGIGITPFRSMIKYLLDVQQRRPITLFYANRTADEIAYKDLLDQAAKQLGIKIIYILTDRARIPAGWRGYVGHITPDLIGREVPDYAERTFMLSGPQAMINGFTKTLNSMGLAKKQVKTDYFPGF